MKYLVALIFVFVLCACSTAPVVIPQAQQYQSQVQPLPKQDKALVYFYVDTKFQSTAFSMTQGGRYAILSGDEDGKELAVVGCGPTYQSRAIHHNCASYTWVYLSPGLYTLTGMFIQHKGTGESITVTLQAGQTYYFQVVQAPAAYSPDISLVSVQAADAIATMQTYKYCAGLSCDIPDEDSYNPVFVAAKKKRQAAASAAKARALQEKLGCTDEQMREGTCQ